MTDFKNIDTIDDMLSFLKNKGNNHKLYHHYTNITNLIKMISSNFFLLTRGNSVNMNDQHEYRAKGSAKLWNKTYLGSFAYGDSENMAMWGLYGLPWEEAVRISIPKITMEKWIGGISDVFSAEIIDGTFQTEKLRIPFHTRLSDIVYIGGKQESSVSNLYWSGETLSLRDKPMLNGIDTAPDMTGFIKNNAWKYENEVRIHIQLQEEINKEQIAIELPNEVISSMVITAGPYFKGVLKEKIGKKKLFVINKNSLKESGFKNLVKYRSLCTMCKHKSFVRKRGETMATNPPKGDGHRNGAVKERSQTFNPKTEQWVKRNSDTGRFMDVKQDGKPFKGVRKEK